jgi:hypothetical protein
MRPDPPRASTPPPLQSESFKDPFESEAGPSTETTGEKVPPTLGIALPIEIYVPI